MDCMLYMKTCQDNQFDLAIVDPPYFQEYGKKIYPGSKISTTGVKRNRFESKHWEVPSSVYFNELQRISRNQIIWGINYYAKYVNDVGRIVWDKEKDSSTFSKCEIASHSFGLRVDQFRFMWNGMIQGDMKNKERRIHPTQKPVKLYEWLLMNYANEGDNIIDTHYGSGSIGVACDNLGFNLTATEIDKEYYDAACKRLDDHRMQLQLF